MTDKEIHEWVKERDSVVLTHDIQKFKEFYEKWKRRGIYILSLPENDLVVRASMEKAILEMANPPEKDKQQAVEWLVSHGFTT